MLMVQDNLLIHTAIPMEWPVSEDKDICTMDALRPNIMAVWEFDKSLQSSLAYPPLASFFSGHAHYKGGGSS